jgi:hypothetical protein
LRDDGPVKFFWRTEADPLASHAAWIESIDTKNRQPGTSAPTLATVWSGPLDLLAALATHPELTNISILSAIAEAKATFDSHGGNVRNHDLVLRAIAPSGGPVVVCVEAKAGESLGATVREQALSAKRAKDANPKSKGCGSRRGALSPRFC